MKAAFVDDLHLLLGQYTGVIQDGVSGRAVGLVSVYSDWAGLVSVYRRRWSPSTIR